MKEKSFYNEIDYIQKQHALFFPLMQIDFIRLKKENGRYELYFTRGYNLDEVITTEIQMAFSLIFPNRTATPQ